MKKVPFIFLALLIAFFCRLPLGQAAVIEPSIFIDGQELTFEVAPYVDENQRTLVPIRFVSEALGGKVFWDGTKQEVKIKQESKELILHIGKTELVVNGQKTKMDTAPSLKNRRTMIPLRFISEHLGARVNWNEKSHRIDIIQNPRANPSGSRGESESRRETDFPLIKEVSVTSQNGVPILNIKGAKSLEYNTFFLQSPSRFVLDINKAHLSPDLIAKASISVNQSPVKTVRMGQFDNETIRIVVDLSKPADMQFTSGQNSDALVLSMAELTGRLRGKTIVVDPGHGKIQPGGWPDPGAVGPTGLTELEVVLDISKKLAAMLRSEGARVVLTHSGTTNRTLAGRAAVATNNNADAFISIHANGHHNRSVNGTMTFYHSSGPNAWQNQQLARSVQNSLFKALGTVNHGTPTANFAVLRSNSVPAILVETAFISNYWEERLLRDPAFRTRAAAGIHEGVLQYFSR